MKLSCHQLQAVWSNLCPSKPTFPPNQEKKNATAPVLVTFMYEVEPNKISGARYLRQALEVETMVPLLKKSAKICPFDQLM